MNVEIAVDDARRELRYLLAAYKTRDCRTSVLKIDATLCALFDVYREGFDAGVAACRLRLDSVSAPSAKPATGSRPPDFHV